MPRRKTTWTRRLIRERSWRFSEAVDECLIFCGIDGEDYAEFSGEKDVRILLGRPELDAFVELMESQTAPHPHRVLVLDDHMANAAECTRRSTVLRSFRYLPVS